MSDFLLNVSENYYPEKSEGVLDSLFSQYETVILESIISSFGLNFLFKDQHGGDVDTIYNVRQIGIDPKMTYKNKKNQEAYDSLEKYNPISYHSHPDYRAKYKEVQQSRQKGSLTDAYTGEKLPRDAMVDVDHVKSAKTIHNDRGRVLAGLKGENLANSPENLVPTSAHINRSKKNDDMAKHLAKHEDEYTVEQKRNMQKIDERADKAYNAKLARAYYPSPKFAKDVALAAGKSAVKMGIKQVFGLVFTEIWFSIKAEFEKLNSVSVESMDLGIFLETLGNGVNKGLDTAKSKHEELISKFATGTLSGALSSVTTTICNIFFTTSQNVVRIIRLSFPSLVEAGKVLLFNPENYSFGDRLRAALKLISLGASVAVGSVISEVMDKTLLGKIPVVGDVIVDFCRCFCTGVLSCTLLYFLDRSEIINCAVAMLNTIATYDDNVRYFTEQALFFEKYAAELMKIDLDKFKKETAAYHEIAEAIDLDMTQKELNAVIRSSLSSLGIVMSWEKTHSDFNSFMSDKSARMVFE